MLAQASAQCGNLRVGPQLPLDIVSTGSEDDAGGAVGLELGETLAQLVARACEGHLLGGGDVDERVMAVRDIEIMTAVNGEMASMFATRSTLASHASPFGSAFTLSGSVVYLW